MRDQVEIDAMDYEARLVMLVGLVSDQLHTAGNLRELRLKANASVVTRGQLDFLVELHGALLDRLNAILEEAKALASAASTRR